MYHEAVDVGLEKRILERKILLRFKMHCMSKNNSLDKIEDTLVNRKKGLRRMQISMKNNLKTCKVLEICGIKLYGVT